MIEDPEILTTEGSELTSTKGDEGSWLRPKNNQMVLTLHDEEEGSVGTAQHCSDILQQGDSNIDASYDDIDTLKSEEILYRFSKGPNSPLNYGKMLPLFKRRKNHGYYVYLGPDCRFIF